MIEKDLALQVHERLIQEFGGGQGIRDEGGLESALMRPYSTFDGQELYPTAVEKSSAIIESILINHPFVDGNKRTGYVLMRLTLMLSGLDIQSTQAEKYEFVISISKGEKDIDSIKEWIKEHVVELEK